MTDTVAGFICATGIWVVCALAAAADLPKRPAGEAWVVTSSEKIASRPMLVRASVPFAVAGGWRDQP